MKGIKSKIFKAARVKCCAKLIDWQKTVTSFIWISVNNCQGTYIYISGQNFTIWYSKTHRLCRKSETDDYVNSPSCIRSSCFSWAVTLSSMLAQTINCFSWLSQNRSYKLYPVENLLNLLTIILFCWNFLENVSPKVKN